MSAATVVTAARLKVLVAEDEAVSRLLLTSTLTRFGYDVVAVEDGARAWEVLQGPQAPALAVLDWSMPGLDGPDICERIRARKGGSYTYVLLVTARSSKSDLVAGLSAGADDFISKPVDPDEIRARLRVGERVLRLEQSLAEQIHKLQEEKAHVQELQGMIPICMHCKRIRGQEQIWERVETYIEQRSGAKFSHALCQDCLEKHYPEDEPG
ncbi:MAG: response regulator transcription factor [Myxococcaceae bacterium]|nr:response regulator transcription factor [Myxococcaceae bacterium]